jgi:hypothetical protein
MSPDINGATGSDVNTLIEALSVTVHLKVDDLLEATRRLGLDTATAHGRNATLEVRLRCVIPTAVSCVSASAPRVHDRITN